MPSRRRLLAGVGTVATGLIAGCSADPTTSGVVARKRVTVAVPRRVGEPVETALALLAFEPDRDLIHGEYDPEHVDGAVERGTLSVAAAAHERLSDEFVSVRYSVNVVPEDGETPANGVVDRETFDALSVGGTARVATTTEDGVGRIDVRERTPRDGDPAEITVSQFDVDERTDD
ncbi:hypothetical protein [Halosimplex amylolyticum]|uniref:hypothetical protein n=1 Tax=Halosimplex amylolyticum TaxID=3396616 RepID=UPI003F57495E